MSFRITGLPSQSFRHLYGLPDGALAEHNAKRVVASESPGFPDRIELRDAHVGESLILVNFEHQPANSPYRASHAVYVLEGAENTFDAVDTVPEVLRRRLLSLRAFDGEGMMLHADIAEGKEMEALIGTFLADEKVSYIQAHYARPGCYAARIERAASRTD
jgi:Protein of unknown function (DUF1203)